MAFKWRNQSGIWKHQNGDPERDQRECWCLHSDLNPGKDIAMNKKDNKAWRGQIILFNLPRPYK